MPSTLQVFFSLCLIFTLLLSAHANVCPGSTPKERRVTLVSTSGTSISAEIEKDPNIKRALRQISTHFSQVGRSFTQGNSENGRPFSCVFSRNDAVKSVSRVIESYGWGPMQGCLTKVSQPGTHHHLMKKSKKLFRAVRQFAEGVSSAQVGDMILKTATIDGLTRPWQKAYTNGILKYNAKSTYHDCEIARALAFRVQGEWRIAASFTNEPVSNKSGLHERLYFKELVYINNATNSTKSFPVRISSCDANDRVLSPRLGSAFVVYSSGTGAWSDFLTTPIANNPAILSVLDDIDGKETNIAQDSDTASNFAILLLPVTLALVPISLFQDVGPFVALGYIIVTDVISVLPVAIKGVELIQNARHRHHTTMSYVYGSRNSTVLAAETWVSFCKLKSLIRQRGVILLSIAVTAMAFGMFLEFLTRARVTHLKKRLHDSLDEADPLTQGVRGLADHKAILKYMQSSSGGGLLWHLEQTKNIVGTPETHIAKWPETPQHTTPDDDFRSVDY